MTQKGGSNQPKKDKNNQIHQMQPYHVLFKEKSILLRERRECTIREIIPKTRIVHQTHTQAHTSFVIYSNILMSGARLQK
jgi:hypothetical protein